MHQVLDVYNHLRVLVDHPLATVISVALIAAVIDQRYLRKRPPDFPRGFSDIDRPRP